MSFTETIEPVADVKCLSIDGVDLISAWSSAVEDASCVGGNLAFDGELDGCFLLVVGVKLRKRI